MAKVNIGKTERMLKPHIKETHFNTIFELHVIKG